MKLCKICGREISTRGGINECNSCHNSTNTKRAVLKQERKEQDSLLEDIGLVKVKGAMGGIYWE